MTRRLALLAVLVTVLVGGFAWRLHAQVQAVVAFCFLDPQSPTGVLQPTATGWTWAMVCAYNDPNTGHKDVVGGVLANTLNGDTLNAVGLKLASAAKADGAQRGFAVQAVLIPQSVLVVPQ